MYFNVMINDKEKTNLVFDINFDFCDVLSYNCINNIM